MHLRVSKHRIKTWNECMICGVLKFLIFAFFVVVNLTLIDLPGLTKVAVGKYSLILVQILFKGTAGPLMLNNFKSSSSKQM